jgi:hypothetical protein
MSSNYKMFVFGETLERAINAIPETEQLRFYKYIVKFGIDGEEPQLQGFELATWVQMKDIILRTMPKKRKAPEKKDENNENNLRNGNSEKQLRQLDADELTDHKSANGNGNVNVNGNGNDNVNVNVNDQTNLENSFSSRSPPHSPDLAKRIDDRIKSWNSLNLKPQCRKTALNLIQLNLDRIVTTFKLYADAEIDEAMVNYGIVSGDPAAYFDPGYKSLEGFLANGVEKFVSEAEPLKKYAARGGPPGLKNKPDDDDYWAELDKRANNKKAEGGLNDGSEG